MGQGNVESSILFCFAVFYMINFRMIFLLVTIIDIWSFIRLF